MNFKLLSQDGKARVGELDTFYGKIETPVFMPVGTLASVKGITKQTLEKLNYNIILSNTASFVNWPKIPKIELISINNDAEVTIFLGLSAFNKKRMGLRKIPPPIPTIPEISPMTEPTKIEKIELSFFIVMFFST